MFDMPKIPTNQPANNCLLLTTHVYIIINYTYYYYIINAVVFQWRVLVFWNKHIWLHQNFDKIIYLQYYINYDCLTVVLKVLVFKC